MQDFEKVGEAYEGILSTPLQWLFIAIMLLVVSVLIGIFIWIYKAGEGTDIAHMMKRIVLFSVFVAVVLIIYSSFELQKEMQMHQDYKGRFEIVQSQANEVVDSKEENRVISHISKNKIVLKDRKGNKQEFEVDNKDGIFRKGDYAEITVKTLADKAKPTLAKPIDSGNFEVKKIKQVEP